VADDAVAELGWDLLRRPDTWDRLLQRDASSARSTAARVADDDTAPLDVRALATNALSRALVDLGRLDEARVASERAIALAAHVAEVRSAIVLGATAVLAESGSVDLGLQRLAELAATVDGIELARVRLQASYVLHHAGRLNESLEELERAEQLLGRDAEPRDWLRLHSHRGLVLLQQGRLASAEPDFAAAGELAHELGMTGFEAQCLSNLAVLHGRARRIDVSMRLFAEAAATFERAGNPSRGVTGMEIDRTEVLLHSGLVLDALEAARHAVSSIEPHGNRMQLGDALVLLAKCELAADRPRDAVRTAEVAAAVLTASARPEMVTHVRALAAHAELRALGDADAVADRLDASVPLVDELRTVGWHQHADELMVARIRCAHHHQVYGPVAGDLARLRLGAWSDQRDVALAGWFAEAVARRSEGDVGGSLDSCLAGLHHLDDIVAEAPTLEARSAAMRLGNDLSQLAIDLAVELGDADTVLAAAEGTRARALHDEIGGERRHTPLTAAGAAQLRRELAARLGARVLVEWVVSRGAVWAVVFGAVGSRLVRVGEVADVVRARDRVLVWLDLAAGEPDGSSVRAMRAAAALDDLLVGPLGLPRDAGVVHVPVGLLHGIPWAGLPSFAGRPMTLVPNAQVWLESDRRASGGVRTAGLVAGPEVVSAPREWDAVSAAHPEAAIAAGPGATAATVRSMFAGCDLVHVAAHGRFRADRPLLSTLTLADGAATLYDAVPDRIAARLVVLSSCEGGAQGTADGSEVLGLSSVLLARGAASVLAPLTAVRDLECADFVVDVHAELARGEPFACAVANVRERWIADDDLSRWAVASSFACFGSGAVVSHPVDATDRADRIRRVV
jgi:tetratricopeptide (TPR) repeat protein